MANLRIRYEDHPTRDNSLISKQSFTSTKTGARYKIVLDVENMIYMVRNERSKEFSFKSELGQYNNLHALKAAARRRLGKLGVPIGKEVRMRTFGLCEKGHTQEKEEKKR